MEAQVQKAPNPIKISLLLLIKVLLIKNMTDPKIVDRLPTMDTTYHILKSRIFSEKLRVFQDSCRRS